MTTTQNLIIDNVGVRYPGRRNEPGVDALVKCNFTLADGEIVCIVGPSGCGKSTLFNVIAGLLEPTSGSIKLGSGKKDIKVGCVFQTSRLLPWASISDNIAFAIKGSKPDASQEYLDDTVARLLQQVHLDGFGNSLPKELSGGMQQRASVARALAIDPDLMLMDEPFGALDALTRLDMQTNLSRDFQRIDKSVILITHDIDEALLLGDRVLVLTHRPGTIKTSIDVPFERPRVLSDLEREPAFVKLRSHLLKQLHEEFYKQKKHETR